MTESVFADAVLRGHAEGDLVLAWGHNLPGLVGARALVVTADASRGRDAVLVVGPPWLDLEQLLNRDHRHRDHLRGQYARPLPGRPASCLRLLLACLPQDSFGGPDPRLRRLQDRFLLAAPYRPSLALVAVVRALLRDPDVLAPLQLPPERPAPLSQLRY